ncbi:MAG: leucine--tRNA ligase [Deltaproteobacteria bacterium RIFCSPLOWO2_01_44_7]|nr:MAG: leucine--tRNA ligase [Deltaproteobacteria bacterium RIFCSPLOWO2_01_44_7]
MEMYDPQTIEPKWQKFWDDKKLFKASEDSKKEKYYLLEMLPYPSGRIHMGHVRNYTIGDVAARFKMMQGFCVLHPMGWDAFGLPAENAAIKNKIHPAKWTYENIDVMRSQLKRMGYSYDWDREFATCDPEYYRWEQLIFLKMVEKGLAFKKSSSVNWCDGCQTVLANEQVEQGKCWRCDTVVVQKSMEQWFFKITDYADELLQDIDDKLQGWPERVRVMQKNWIGKSLGVNIFFKVKDSKIVLPPYTTRCDTVFSVTFIAIAPENPIVLDLVQGTKYEKGAKEFIAKVAKQTLIDRENEEKEKEGFFIGKQAINPASGEEIPIYIANFALMYGTGIVMCDAHDKRDFKFAKKYGIPLKFVISKDGKPMDANKAKEAFTDDGILFDSGEFSGMKNQEALPKMADWLEKKKFGEKTINYKLRDWLISRQRYWGAPIPIIYCDKCGTVPVPEKDLPVVLPTDVEFTGEGGSPLAQHSAFVNTTCPKCKKKARRETDTMDTFVESSWYLLRYCSSKYEKGPVDPKAAKFWMPIDQYIGGIEHAVGHLIYCRFFTKVMRDLKMIDLNEPVVNLLTQGMVCLGGSAMSKSKGNIVDPDTIIEKYGADTARLFILFAAPPEKDLDWNDNAVEGMYRFLTRVWRLVSEVPSSKHQIPNKEGEVWKHRTIKRVTEDIERFHFNTALSALMEYVNFLSENGTSREALETLVILLSPLAPHIAEELWQHLGHKESVLETPWPKWDPKALVASSILIAVQVNGRLRGTVEVPTDSSEEEIKNQAQRLEKVQAHVAGKQIAKVIYVPKKLVNIVVRD